jgi:anaerobic ribonucleoside-triphosphate reductase activating protein
MIFKCAGISDSLNDGIGISLDIFFQGCSKRCVGCQNTTLQQFNGGFDYETDFVVKHINKNINFYDSVVFVGGEPLEQPYALYDLVKKVSLPKVLYTGLLYNDIPRHIRDNINVIIDGIYDEELRTDKFPASSNQKIYINGDLIENTSNIWRRI